MIEFVQLLDPSSPSGNAARLLVGNDQANTLIGNAASNVIKGLGGNDELFGLEGDDTLDGGVGADTIVGGAGDDIIIVRGAEAANDTIDAGSVGETLGDTLKVVDLANVTFTQFDAAVAGIEIWSGNKAGLIGTGEANRFDLSALVLVTDLAFVDGAGGDDALIGTKFADVLRGGSGNDSLQGGDGDDLMTGGQGADTIDGGAGNDTASYAGSTTAVSVSLSTGTGTGGDALGDSLVNIENLIGSSFNDVLTGDQYDNVLIGGIGADKLDGTSGNDTASYATSTAGVTVNLSLTTAQVSAGDAAGDILSNIDNLIGSNFADVLTGDANDNTIDGGLGNDLIEGGAGADTLRGGAGIDTLSYSR